MSSISHKKRHIILIGYRGVGKSTTGELLSKKLGYPFYDSDEEIVKESGISIPEIFKETGEPYFRQIENRQIQLLCQQKKAIILSTGGGAILSEENRACLKESGLVILLTASEESIFQRIKDDSNRPSLTQLDLKGEIHTVLKHRNPLYRSIKDFEIDTSKTSVEEVIKEILNFISIQKS